jgi:cobaltochelatase CobS
MAGTLSVDEFRARIASSMPSCRYCGFKAHSLVRHLSEKHNKSAGQYKNEFGNNSPLVSPVTAELLRMVGRKSKSSDDLEQFVQIFEPTTAAPLFANLKPKFPKPAPELAIYVPSVNPDFVFEPKTVKSVAYGLLRNSNVYVEGPTGSGKTDGVEQIHANLGLPIRRVNMNGDVTVANFIGSMRADATKGTYFMYGALPTAMKLGITLLIDEMDYTPANIAAVLNPVLEKKRSLYLPETGETIVAAPGFTVVGTGNTGGKGDETGMYTGTEVMNTALLDRFPVKLTVDYLPKDEEVKMLVGRFPDKDRAMIQKMVEAAIEIRKSFRDGVLPVTISTRKLIDILDMEYILGREEALNNAVLNWMGRDNLAVARKILENHGLVSKK